MAAGYDGTVRIDTRMDTKGFNAGIAGIARSLKGLLVQMGLVFGLGLVTRFGKNAVDAAGQLAGAMVGLQSVVDGQGKSFDRAKAFINEYTQDGLIPAADAITAYKNLLMRGYSSAQAEKALTILKDTSAFGRQAGLSMGEAVKRASEGLKNENSLLVDNAGVTKNVAKMWEDWAKAHGTNVASMTKEQKILAEMNGLQEESKFQTGDAAKMMDTYAGKVARLSASFQKFKVAAGNAIMPLVEAILPYLTVLVDWLTRVATAFGQVMGAIFGKKMADSAKSTKAAADAQTQLTENTEEAGKAAKGTLAAFDDLNVLQKDEAENTIDAGEMITDEDVAVDPDAAAGIVPDWITAWVDTAKEKIASLVAGPLALLREAFEAIKPLGVWFWEKFLKPVGEWTGKAVLDALQWLSDRLQDVADWIKNNPKAFETIVIILLSFAAAWWLVNAAITVWTFIAGVATGVTTAFGAAVAFLTSPIGIAIIIVGLLIAAIILLVRNWDKVKEVAGKVWDWIKVKWGEAGKWFKTNVTDPVKNGFSTALASIKTGWENTWTGIKNFVKNTINSIIDFVNGMIRAVVGGINGVINSLNSIRIDIPSILGSPAVSFGLSIPTVSAPQIPRLATGAVIPPNSEFAAILGDQRNGRNIETPEGLLRQIVREELGNIQAEVQIGFKGNLAALVRELKPYIDSENVRIGGSLVKGGVIR